MSINDRALLIQNCRNDFYFFSRYCFKKQRGYNWSKAGHHELITKAMTRVYNGDCKRIIINISPRYGKTQLAVIYFIAWSLGKNPDSEYIHSSYSGRLATTNSYAVRSLVQEDFYREIFPDVTIKQDSKAKDEWRTTEGGCMYAVGSGGTITGYGAGKVRGGFGGAIVLDDMHKADEATSEVMRANVIDWFQNTLESRKNSPHTPIVVIMQRLHEEDLSGWLLSGGNGEEWEHLCIPAINEDGTALWPEKHPIEKLREMEEASPYVFAGQYMQRPAPAAGGMFKPYNMEVIDALPLGVSIIWCRGWDLAVSVDGAYTVGLLMGKLPDSRVIIADIARVRAGAEERDACLLNTARRDGVRVRQSIPQDPGQAGKSQIKYFAKLLSGFKVSFSPESGDKIARAEPVASQVNVGNVLMLKGDWNMSLMNEMAGFPNAKYKDQVDALSRAYNELIGKRRMSISDDLVRARI